MPLKANKPLLIAFFYDRVMSTAEQACLAGCRRELLGQAH